MLIVTLMRAIREIIVEAAELRRVVLKRYPNLSMD